MKESKKDQPLKESGVPQNASAQADQKTEVIEQFIGPQKEKIALEWKAPSRPFKKHKKQYFTTILTIALLLCLILFFAGQVLTVAVVLAVAFLSYIMATIPPHTVTNSVTTLGVRNEEALYYWEELGNFWFEKKHADEVLYIEVGRFPFRLALLLGGQSKEELTELLSEVLVNQKPPLSQVEKWAAWLQKKVPLDIDS